MKNLRLLRNHPARVITAATFLLATFLATSGRSAPATLLFEDNFDGGVPGWTAFQPAGATYFDGPMLWQYDVISQAFIEQSNIYTDSAVFSGSRIAAMLINDTIAPTNFTFSARLMTGDDDAFGLIWGFEDDDSFYRVTFARQNRALLGWPFQGAVVDRMNNGQVTTLFGPDTSFVNTAGQPFDVTITVSNGLLTLTIVDDPEGAAIVHNFVSGGALPTAPSARVGMFTWGMQPAGGLRGFRIWNLSLSPTALDGNLSSVLSDWSFLITPRADGTTNMNSALPPTWSMGFDANGPTGTMFENSDSFLNADNTAAGTTNYAAPSAVAGDVNWTNYIYTARITSEDDDGVGVLFRYLNETNFYRIGFRSQNSTSGVKRGVSGQKNVNLNFDEIFSSTSFIYTPGVPFDVHTSIQSNRLQVLVVNNPESTSAQGFFFGPFDITGLTVPNGKIGIFSWAQFSGVTARDSGTEVDSVKVQQVAGEGLIVNSPFGAPDPPVGLNDFPVSSVVTASVDSVVVTSPGIRQVLTGWSGFGAVPASGTTNQISFTLTTLSLITWNWRTEYLLSASSSAGGSVSATSGPWIPDGTNVTVTATPNAGFIFLGWSGDSVSTTAMLTFPMLRPISLTANFAADSDADGLADTWELQYFGNLAQTGAGNPDGDAFTNAEEFARGSNPNFAEALIVSDGLGSQWINTQRDPALPSNLRVVNFGPGYRGAWDDGNDNRFGNDFTFIASTNAANFASFQGPRLIVKSNLWNESWSTNFSATMEISVGDNDGNCFYFRYIDEQNWYRVTLCGEDPQGNTARPPLGLSVQRRVNGNYDSVSTNYITGDSFVATPDPIDTTGFKKLRLTVNATNENFEVRVAGWVHPIFDTNSFPEYVVTFTDTNHATGRIGFGPWGQGGFGTSMNETNNIPIPLGAFHDNIVVVAPVGGSTVFSEDWESVPLANEFPAGWSNPYAGEPDLEGDWRMSAHGTIAQQSNFGPLTSGNLSEPSADADSLILLAPAPSTNNYFLEIGFHPFDNDGIGFVYDFQDTNNYSRVIFRTETTFSGDIPPGLSVSRKSGGVWTDIVAGDASFLFTPGVPFGVEFANNNGTYQLLARDLDNPTNTFTWYWTGTPAAAANRFGVTTWAFQDAHVLYARAFSLPEVAPIIVPEITNISLSGGNVILDISNPGGATYNVRRGSVVTGPYPIVGANQTGTQFIEAIPGGMAFYLLELVP